MSPELAAKRDAAISRLEGWDGQPIDVQESFRWHPDETGPSPRGPVGYFRLPLGLGLNMGTGALTLAHPAVGRATGVAVDYGVLLHRLVSVEFPGPDAIEFVEQLGPQVWRRSLVRRLADAEPGAASS